MTRSKFLRPHLIVLAITVGSWLLLALDSPWHLLGEQRSFSVATVLAVWGWTLWVVVATALLVPSAISLTAVRIVIPVSVAASFMALSPISIFASLVMFVICASPLFADTMVQGGAYGDEIRFTLKTPVPYMAPASVAWLLLCGTLLPGTLFLAAEQWWVGGPLTLVGLVLARFVPLRLHRLARRWLVVVPAGIVVHDHLVLAETVMSTKNNIARIVETSVAGETADFTGGVLGRRIAVHLLNADKVVLSRITMKTLGTTEALHVKAFSIAPRRLHAAMSTIRR
jgi:hypothetical protein